MGSLRTFQTSANEPLPTIATRSKSAALDVRGSATRAVVRADIRETAGAGKAGGIGGGLRRNGRNRMTLCINSIGCSAGQASARVGHVGNLSLRLAIQQRNIADVLLGDQPADLSCP